MRILLFTGKGGVGKTTLAAATAAALADRGGKTLVVSTDPAHSLGDAFGRPLGADPAPVDRDLHAVQVDPRGLVDATWQDLRGRLRQALTGVGVDALDAAELTVLPGVDEVLALTEVRRLAETGPWGTVVVDCGPTAETLRLLALPEAVSGYLRRMFGRPGERRWGEVAGAVRRLGDHLDGLRALLTDGDVTSVRLVLTPERVVAAETRRTLTALALRGIRVDGLVVNRVLPAPGRWGGAAGAWLRTRRAEQDTVLAELAAAGVPDPLVRSVEHRAAEPVGLPALRAIAAELYGAADPLASAAAGAAPLLRVSGTANGYRLRVALPLTPDARIDLARVDDDLAITVDGVRRLVALPEALRPCEVTGAECDPAGLLVFLSGGESR
ncbi:arsenite-transporting ATPase [Amycolatopsis arida]|uniref:Arsenite-transporting ATPase n=1 Tax=Amycolatopsis arida TaxID=587909 RepID=A0A1I5VIS5_9PSEU|nr:ArsA family ATPase [Amycolatopsis arida]TDX87903.1 arsenite-transporting ATPase [Amycolatopsis arida]SFQ07369.1 arsenite-transporting ATPase [Amycolatopsis arida]